MSKFAFLRYATANHFIDEHLVEVFTLLDQVRLQLINVMIPVAVQTLAPAASPTCPSLAPFPFFCLITSIKTRSSAENAMFIV